jgi:hypothetical protein
MIPERPFYFNTGGDDIYVCEDSGKDHAPFIVSCVNTGDDESAFWTERWVSERIRKMDWLVINGYVDKRLTEDKPSKTITLDPMLDARLTNIDRMILEREIELKLLRKLKGEEK